MDDYSRRLEEQRREEEEARRREEERQREILRQKYRNLRSQLLDIKNRLEKLETTHDAVFSYIKQSLLINNKIVEEESFRSLKDDEKDILNRLNNVITQVTNRT